MNNQKCQMYIVFGNDNYRNNPRFQNRLDKNPYYYFFTKVSAPIDPSLFNKSFMQEYSKVWNVLKKINIQVANKIIFIIPDESYMSFVTELMNKLNYVGQIKIVPEEKKPQEKHEEPKEVPENINEEPKVPVIEKEEEKKEEPKEINNDKEPEISSPIPKPQTNIPNPYYNPNDNVFYKPQENPNSNISITPNITSQNNPKNVVENVQPKSNKKEKNNKKVSLALIIFIISFILLLTSIILLISID